MSLRFPARRGTLLVDSRSIHVAGRPADAFAPIRRIGGDAGWYFANRLWRLRGRLDRVAGGVGFRLGRPDPEEPETGAQLDSWRVEAYQPGRLLRLRAEMKLPGRAWLQFEVAESHSGSVIRQTTLFAPRGLPGLVYWYAMFPAHSWVFAGMLTEIARRG